MSHWRLAFNLRLDATMLLRTPYLTSQYKVSQEWTIDRLVMCYLWNLAKIAPFNQPVFFFYLHEPRQSAPLVGSQSIHVLQG